jgi:putative FmdB family regulatory protein
MPLYEYLCGDCERSFDQLVSFAKADDPQRCPHCGGEHTQRKLSTFAAHHSGGSAAPVSARPARSPFS